jgi:hypothetical protein
MVIWRIEDDCIAKSSKITLNYNGPNPFSIYQRVKNIIKLVMLVKGEDIWERDFRWTNIGDPKSFFIRLYVSKKLDLRTSMLFELVFQGSQPSDPNKNGNLTLSISARLITDYKLESAFQQSILYRNLLRLYHLLFYNEVRRSFLNNCGEYIDKIFERIRSELKLETKAV